MSKWSTAVHLSARRRCDDTLAGFLAGLSPRPRDLCDLGCHDGRKTLRWAEAAGVEPAACVGVDVRARPTSVVTVRAADLERDVLPLGDSTVDLVVASQVLEHLKNVHWVLAEANRVLREGGVLAVASPNLASAHNRLLLAAGRQPTAIRTQSPHVRGFTVGEVLTLLTAFGFEPERSAGAGFYPLRSNRAARVCERLLPEAAVYQCHVARRRRRVPKETLAGFATGDTTFTSLTAGDRDA